MFKIKIIPQNKPPLFVNNIELLEKHSATAIPIDRGIVSYRDHVYTIAAVYTEGAITKVYHWDKDCDKWSLKRIINKSK